jgi:predicted transcriptional regulator
MNKYKPNTRSNPLTNSISKIYRVIHYFKENQDKKFNKTNLKNDLNLSYEEVNKIIPLLLYLGLIEIYRTSSNESKLFQFKSSQCGDLSIDEVFFKV